MSLEVNRCLTLRNGASIPVVGLGTWKSKPGDAKRAVEMAIDSGYRHIDCAFLYGNEAEIGDAIKLKIMEGSIKREDLFITSKVWPTYFRQVEQCLSITLKNLKLPYVDLYLMHWPFALQYISEDHYFPTDENGKAIGDDDLHYVDVWKQLEVLHEKGLVKNIGVSNFNIYQLEKLLSKCKIPPSVHQFEMHPYLNQENLLEFCRSNDIVVTGYSPFGSPDRPWAKPGDPDLLHNSELTTISSKYGKTNAQVILRYLIQKRVSVIPKSVSLERIRENLDIFDFTISKEDESLIAGMNRNWRALDLPYYRSVNKYPFRERYDE